MTRAARERLAAAIRTLVAHAVEADLEGPDSERASDALERVVADLDALPRRGPKNPTKPEFDDLQQNFGYDPVVGKSNPIAPPVEITCGGVQVTPPSLERLNVTGELPCCPWKFVSA